MAYDANPKLPRIRARAVEMIRRGRSVTEVSRYFGYTKGAVSKWCKKVPPGGAFLVPTESCAPKHHPWRIKEQIRSRICELRVELKGRCAQVIQSHLLDEGFRVSVRTIQRELERRNMLKKYSPWKKRHISTMRPKALNPGDLVQLDTIHLSVSEKRRIYVYTMIDVVSRVAFARASFKATSGRSIKFLESGLKKTLIAAICTQSDHGPEFGSHFTTNIQSRHRHSRVRKPNDNAHIERFNRTIQDECLTKLPRDVKLINKELPKYLNYYNTKRRHLGLGLKTPAEMLKSFPSYRR